MTTCYFRFYKASHAVASKPHITWCHVVSTPPIFHLEFWIPLELIGAFFLHNSADLLIIFKNSKLYDHGPQMSRTDRWTDGWLTSLRAVKQHRTDMTSDCSKIVGIICIVFLDVGYWTACNSWSDLSWSLETTLFNRDNQCFPDSHPL